MTTQPLAAGDPDALRAAIAEQPFCTGLTTPQIVAMAAAAAVTTYPADTFVFRRGTTATAFHLVVDGSVALEVSDPGRQPLTIETLHTGDPLGWSWLFPARTWQFDAHCLTDVTTIAFEAEHLRRLVEDDAVFGRDLVLRIGQVVVNRMLHARAQLIDIHHHERTAAR